MENKNIGSSAAPEPINNEQPQILNPQAGPSTGQASITPQVVISNFEPAPSTANQVSHLKRKLLIPFTLVIVVLAGSVAAYFRFRQAPKAKNQPIPGQNSTSTPATVSDTSGQTIPANLAAYDNKELGIRFSYPSHWGQPVMKTREDPDRQVTTNGYTEYDISFPKAPLMLLPIINKKNNYLVQYAGCFNEVGFLDFELSQEPSFFKVGEVHQSNTAAGNSYTTYTKTIVNDSNMVMIIDFQVSTVVNASDYCNGLSVFGKRTVKNSTKNVDGIQYIWSKTASTFGKDQPKLGIADLEDFKKSQDKYISKEDLTNLQTMIQSIQTY